LHVLQKVGKASLGGVFSDQNKSWLKRKAQEDDSDDELAAPQNSDSEGNICAARCNDVYKDTGTYECP
jgi:hypothetical protein